jgi:hypothetical protein
MELHPKSHGWKREWLCRHRLVVGEGLIALQDSSAKMAGFRGRWPNMPGMVMSQQPAIPCRRFEVVSRGANHYNLHPSASPALAWHVGSGIVQSGVIPTRAFEGDQTADWNTQRPIGAEFCRPHAATYLAASTFRLLWMWRLCVTSELDPQMGSVVDDVSRNTRRPFLALMLGRHPHGMRALTL